MRVGHSLPHGVCVAQLRKKKRKKGRLMSTCTQLCPRKLWILASGLLFFWETWLVQPFGTHCRRRLHTSHSRATAEKKSFLTWWSTVTYTWSLMLFDTIIKVVNTGGKMQSFLFPHPVHEILIRLTKVERQFDVSFTILRNYSSCFIEKRRRYSVDFHSYFITPTYLICLSCVTPVPWRSNKIRNSFELASGWYVQVFRFSFRSSLRCILSTLNFHLCWRMIYTHISPSSPLFYSLTYSIYPLAIWLNPYNRRHIK